MSPIRPRTRPKTFKTLSNRLLQALRRPKKSQEAFQTTPRHCQDVTKRPQDVQDGPRGFEYCVKFKKNNSDKLERFMGKTSQEAFHTVKKSKNKTDKVDIYRGVKVSALAGKQLFPALGFIHKKRDRERLEDK